MREGKADDLRRIRRVGQNFLIAGHRRIKANFTNSGADMAYAVAIENLAIGKHKGGSWILGRLIRRHSYESVVKKANCWSFYSPRRDRQDHNLQRYEKSHLQQNGLKGLAKPLKKRMPIPSTDADTGHPKVK